MELTVLYTDTLNSPTYAAILTGLRTNGLKARHVSPRSFTDCVSNCENGAGLVIIDGYSHKADMIASTYHKLKPEFQPIIAFVEPPYYEGDDVYHSFLPEGWTQGVPPVKCDDSRAAAMGLVAGDCEIRADGKLFLSDVELAQLDGPIEPKELQGFLNGVGYCQWTDSEFAAGLPFDFILGIIESGAPAPDPVLPPTLPPEGGDEAQEQDAQPRRPEPDVFENCPLDIAVQKLWPHARGLKGGKKVTKKRLVALLKTGGVEATGLILGFDADALRDILTATTATKE